MKTDMNDEKDCTRSMTYKEKVELRNSTIQTFVISAGLLGTVLFFIINASVEEKQKPIISRQSQIESDLRLQTNKQDDMVLAVRSNTKDIHEIKPQISEINANLKFLVEQAKSK